MPRRHRPRKFARAAGEPAAAAEPKTRATSAAQRLPEKQGELAPLTEIREKIGEGKDTLRARSEAFQRRRKTTR